LYIEYLTKDTLEEFGGFTLGGQIIHTVRYADDLVLKTNLNWKVLWNGNEHGKNLSDENLREAIPSSDYDR
jgi:hypothetical protein